MHHVLISPVLPSGATYLLNILLELDIRICREPVDTFWISRGDGTDTIDAGQGDVLRQWLPTLSHKSQFMFPEDVSVRWTHEWMPGIITDTPPILFVRDGRDAIYSQYKRLPDTMDFLDYLHKPFSTGQFTNGVEFRLPPAEMWAMFCGIWKQLVNEYRGIIIKFEVLKKFPNGEVTRLLRFLQVDRPDDRILAAIEASSFDRAKESERLYLRETKHSPQYDVINRRGKPGEWVETYTEKELAMFSGLPARVLDELGYDSTSIIPTDTGTAPDPEISVLISYGKAAMCSVFVAGLFGDTCNNKIAVKTYLTLIDLCETMDNRPLVLVAAARGLLSVKDPVSSRKILDYTSGRPGLHFYEYIELGKCYLDLGAYPEATRQFLRAAKDIPHLDDYYEMVYILAQSGYYRLLVRVLVLARVRRGLPSYENY